MKNKCRSDTAFYLSDIDKEIINTLKAIYAVSKRIKENLSQKKGGS